MPIKGNKSLRDQIPKGEHLTFVDTIKASFLPNADHNEAGQAINPKEEYLRERAAERAAEAEREKKRGG